MTTVNIDDLLAARDRLNAEKAGAKPGRAPAVAPGGVTDDLSLLAVIGLWLLVTGLLVLKIVVVILMAMAALVEYLSRARRKRAPARRRRS